jgi:hypothetical protein
LVIVTVLFLPLLVLLWFYNHAFLQISVTGSSNGAELTYTITNQSTNDVAEVKTQEHTIKKLLRKGDYEITVQQAETSYVALPTVSGFLSTKTVSAGLQLEKSREFVGNNPGPCMLYADILFSRPCDGNLSELTKHSPATSSSPTVTEAPQVDPNSAEIKSLITFGGQNILLTLDNAYALSVLRPDLTFADYTYLPEFAVTSDYTMQTYDQGFVVYSTDLKTIKYFSSLADTASPIDSPEPDSEISHPVELSTYKNSIGGLFNNEESSSDEASEEKPDSKKLFNGTSEFVFYNTKANNDTYTFNKLYSSGGLCGERKLCLISNNVLDVYDVSSKKAKRLFVVDDVQKILPSPDSLTIIKSNQVVRINPDSKTGFIEYSYGDYKYCGAAQAGAGYVLCLINNKSDKFALYINTAAINKDSIDKKTAELLRDPNISDLSVYKNYIYVSPNLGRPTIYNAQTRGYDYDPDLKQSTNSKIRTRVKEIGIDQSIYTIINPYE